METREVKFKNGTFVRIIASGVTGRVINHRDDRDDEVNTLVEYVDSHDVRHEQWCRETELGAPSASDALKTEEKATGVAANPVRNIGGPSASDAQGRVAADQGRTTTRGAADPDRRGAVDPDRATDRTNDRTIE